MSAIKRRKFIELGVKASLTLPLLASLPMACTPSNVEEIKQLKILILGGTSFLGPQHIATALKRGHSITTFTRGTTKPMIHQELFSQVESLIGDREDNLSALENRTWDVVIDNSGRKTKWTEDTAKLLKDSCDLYVYTSSTGVYYPYLTENVDEQDPVLYDLPEGYNEDLKFLYDFGILKATSERAVKKYFGEERSIIVRPTYMLGPADKTNRFINWPLRLSQGGEIMIPGKESDMVQYADVRDIADFMIHIIENKLTGTFNAAGPKEKQSMQSFVKEAKQAFDAESSFVTIDDYAFLEEKNIFGMVPWIMPTEGDQNSAKINNTKAIENGLTFRPLADTFKDTLGWWNSDSVPQEYRDEYLNNPESLVNKESKVIKDWKNRKS